MNRLKELRKANRMTQSDVAKIVGIGQSGYSFWESGRSKIDDAGLRKLAALYNVSVDYLLGTDNNQTKASIKIPVLGDVAAGIPIETVENIVDYEEIDAGADDELSHYPEPPDRDVLRGQGRLYRQL